jgi:hypothetical protein
VAIQARTPTITIFGLLTYPIGATSMAIGRIIDVYPCIILIWQDFVIIYLTFFVYLVRGFIHYYQYEWVHERLKFYKENENKDRYGRKGSLQVKTKPGFFHKYRKLIEKRTLLRNCGICMLLMAPLPLYASVMMYDRFRTSDSGEVCDDYQWGNFNSLISTIEILVGLFVSFKARKAYDIYNARNDLKFSVLVTLIAFIIYLLSTFANQFGINRRFPISSFASGWLCLGLNYFSGWLPVREIKKQLKAQATSQVTQYPIEQNVHRGSLAELSRFKSFLDYIATDVGVAAFKNFLLKSWAVENLFFVQDVLKYERLATSRAQQMAEEEKKLNDEGKEKALALERNRLLLEALVIFDKYLAPDAQLSVNVRHEFKLSYDEAFTEVLDSRRADKELTEEMILEHECLKPFDIHQLRKIFNPALIEVLVLLSDDLFRRFKSDPEYEKPPDIWQASPIPSSETELIGLRSIETRAPRQSFTTTTIQASEVKEVASQTGSEPTFPSGDSSSSAPNSSAGLLNRLPQQSHESISNAEVKSAQDILTGNSENRISTPNPGAETNSESKETTTTVETVQVVLFP